MLKLENVTKVFDMKGGKKFAALRGVGIELEGPEFCMVLGPSGCGKTTMLNIIGGLDKPTAGELFIENKPSSSFSEADWDNYRTRSIGFIFQNYYLIPHLNVLGNVEIASALAGEKKKIRVAGAKAALERVGLGNKLYQKPNKLSGGEMQRAAIARALINNPQIVLADEPTGALDSVTGGQIMELLNEIAKDRLVIMVTHNPELAAKYGTRIIRMLDGMIMEDGRPSQMTNNGREQRAESKGEGRITIVDSQLKKPSMSFLTALKLSFNNLLTKKLRTALTGVAAAFGIAGLALVIALGSGMSAYVKYVERNTYAAYPLTISTRYYYTDFNQEDYEYPKGDVIIPYDSNQDPQRVHYNNLDEEYEAYINGIKPEWRSSISYSKSYTIRLMIKTMAGAYKPAGSIGWGELMDSEEFVLSQYEMMGNSTYPSEITDVAIVIDKYNRVSVGMLTALGIDYTLGVNLKFSDLLGVHLRLVPNDAYFTPRQHANGNIYYGVRGPNSGYNEEVYDDSLPLRVTAILRPRPKAVGANLWQGINYLPALQQDYYESAKESEAAVYQREHPDINALNGAAISPDDATTYTENMGRLGAVYRIDFIRIYANGYDGRESIKAYLKAFNDGKEEAYKVYHVDGTTAALEELNEFFYAVIFSLAAFASVSLVVSSVMISVIIYISVVERTNEIGLLRSLGARRADIFGVFSSEAVIIGFFAGILGVILAYILIPMVDALAENFIGLGNITRLGFGWAAAMTGLSCALTFIAGTIPGIIAARKNPVTALKAE